MFGDHLISVDFFLSYTFCATMFFTGHSNFL